jgi:4-oxalocrotonate tautomerase
MPLIEVKGFERRFEDEKTAGELIEKLTEAMVEVYGNEVRDETEVILQGVSPHNWGFGGKRRR